MPWERHSPLCVEADICMGYVGADHATGARSAPAEKRNRKIFEGLRLLKGGDLDSHREQLYGVVSTYLLPLLKDLTSSAHPVSSDCKMHAIQALSRGISHYII